MDTDRDHSIVLFIPPDTFINVGEKLSGKKLGITGLPFAPCYQMVTLVKQEACLDDESRYHKYSTETQVEPDRLQGQRKEYIP